LKIDSFVHFGNKVTPKDENKPASSHKAVIYTGVVTCAVGATVAAGLYFRRPKTSDLLYIKNLAKDMSRILGEKISPEQLKSVMGKNELLSILPKMKNENYSPKGNLENGVFKLDLHSHSNYSDGVGNVPQLLDQAAEYGDKLHAKTGEKFIFALSDHDEVEGVREALKIIVKNPKKYQNLRFVPAVELSFAHAADKSSNQTECSELLAHCINPFSKKTTALIGRLHQKRSSMIVDCLSELSANIKGTKFLKKEMDGFYLKTPNENFAYNLHWRVLNYAQIKHRVAQIAVKKNENPEKLYQDLMSNFQVGKNDKSPNNFDNFLKQRNISTDIPITNDEVTKICKKYFPKIQEGKIHSAGENSFEDIIDAFSEDKNVSLGFAHPYFFAKNLEDPISAAKKLIKNSKGLIKTTEKYHQAYPAWTNREEVEELNKKIEELGLLPFGGQDNHSSQIL